MNNIQKKIMIVDDDPKIVKALSLRLGAAGYKTTTTFNGITGLLLAKADCPDLIISDVWMPSGTGLSLAYRLRELKPGLPIIFLTASKQPGLEEKARELGASGFLEKPYEPEVLLKLVAQLLSTPAGEDSREELALASAH
jgi:DNA-binding response OmpR family regulator